MRTLRSVGSPNYRSKIVAGWEFLRRRIAAAPGDTELRLGFAHDLSEAGRTGEALAVLRGVIIANPHNREARDLRDSLYAQLLDQPAKRIRRAVGTPR